MPEEPKARTLFPADAEEITATLTESRVWRRKPIEAMELGHLQNTINWIETQVDHILTILGQDPDSFADEAKLTWIRSMPLLESLHAAVQRAEIRAKERTGMDPSGWLLGPIAALDIETTGLDGADNGIVQYSIGIAKEPGAWQGRSVLVDPGRDIPAEATKIHHITTEQARSEGIPERQALDRITTTLEDLSVMGIPLVVFNAVFDLNFILRRVQVLEGADLTYGTVLDPLVIDRGIDRFRRGKRNLAALCQHYGFEPDPETAHDAAGDARTALRLLWHQMTSPIVAEHFGNTLPSLDDLMVLQRGWYAEHTRHMAEWRARNGEEFQEPDLSWPISE